GALRTLSAMVRALDGRVREDTQAFLREHDPHVGRGFPLLSGMWGIAPGTVASSRWSRATLPPFLDRLPDSLRAIAEDAAVGVKVKPGDLLVREGGPPDGVFILVGGRVQVLATVAPEVSIHLAELGPDSVVGSTLAILGAPHSASCMAIEPVTAVRLDPAVWMGLLSVEAVEASALRVALLQSMSAWIPPIRDRVACSKRCLHGVIRAQLLTP
ncbi:MAG TPA: cyclic nucleotide-binding domain-containing protein, partial [Polyangiaceae bacterium]|nr:cyclic nucleotide-binding domain-containing protein [Polyangiaceae bacterium]